MTQIQAHDSHDKTSVLNSYWEAFRAVRSLRIQAYRWAELVDTFPALQIRIFLAEAEHILDPFLDVLDRIICGESSDALSSIEPLPPIIESVGRFRDLLLDAARHWLNGMIETEEGYMVPRCDDAGGFLAALLDWYWDFLNRDRQQEVDRSHLNDNNEYHLFAIKTLIDALDVVTFRHVDGFIWSLLEVDTPSVFTTLEVMNDVKGKVEAIKEETRKLPDNSIQKYAYLMGKLNELFDSCRTIRGLQDVLIRKAREELASIEEHFALPLV
jgi:hypothetical protein